MSSLVVERSGRSRRGRLLGEAHPRIECWPDSSVRDRVVEALEVADIAGIVLDEAQRYVLERGLGQRPDGSWAARELVVNEPRQNGKGVIIETLELAGLFAWGERLIIHSAHLFDTSKEAMRRLLDRIEGVPEFESRVSRVVRSHGEEGVELRGGQRVRFRTRTKGGGRGLSGDRVILDECMMLPEATMGALMPVVSARPNAQLCYFGSAVDQHVHEDGVTFARLRARGIAGDDRLAYFEWSAPIESPDELSESQIGDRGLWAAANPALGVRITEEAVESELRTLDRRTFATERLGVGDWPRTDGRSDAVIDLGSWRALTDEGSTIDGPVWFAFDVSPDRARGTIAAAGARRDGLRHVEVVDRRHGVGWMVERLGELRRSHRPAGVLCDSVGPAVSIADDLEAAGVRVTRLATSEHVQACSAFYDAVADSGLRHLGDDALLGAVRGAAKRSLGDAWAWSRKGSHVDITPLVAVTLAHYGATRARPAYRTASF